MGRGRRITAAMSVLATAALLVACGGEAESGGPKGGTPAPASSAESPRTESTKARTAARLKSVRLSPEDLDGHYFGASSDRDGKISSQEKEGKRIESAECQPIEDMRVGLLEPEPQWIAAQEVSPRTVITLYAYEQTEASKQILTNVGTALESCVEYLDSRPQGLTVEALPAPDLGDEAVAYKQTISYVWQYYRVVRVGSIVAVFSWDGVFAPDEAPDEVISAQLAKLEKFARDL